MKRFIEACYPHVAVRLVHSGESIFRYDTNVNFVTHHLRPGVERERDAAGVVSMGKKIKTFFPQRRRRFLFTHDTFSLNLRCDFREIRDFYWLWTIKKDEFKAVYIVA